MRREGFSLIEISVVLIVVSVMISGILPYISESQKTNAANDTAERMEAIENAMLTYRAANGFIPCPSNIQATLNSAAFGTADATASCAAATNFTDTNTAAGGVPTKTLGLPDEYGFDGWGRRMVYHVAKALTVAGTYEAGTGSITVNDAAGTARTTAAAYAIVSHGPNGHGAYTRAGGTARFSFGSTNANEQENCECNASATATAYDSILTQFMATPNSNPLAAYDDIVRYTLKPNLELLVGGAGGGTGSCTGIAPSGWPDAITCSNGSGITVKLYYSAEGATGQQTYRHIGSGAEYALTYSSAKAYSSHVNLAAYDCVTGSMSISALEAAGKTFNFCGGSGGAGWEDVPLTDTANFDTNCQYRAYLNGYSGFIYAGYVNSLVLLMDVSVSTMHFGAIDSNAKSTWDYAQEGNTTSRSGGPLTVNKIEKNCGGGGGTGTKGLAVSGSSTALVAATPTDIVFSSAPTNNDFGASAWTGNKTFTVPAGEGGWYVLTGYSYVTAGVTSNMVTYIVVNGTAVAWGRDLSSSTALTGQSVAAAVNLSPGDTVVLRGQSSSATTVSAAQLGIVKVSGGGGGSTAAKGFTLSGGAQVFPNSTWTTVTNYSTTDMTDMGDSVLAAGVITIGAQDAGWWTLSGGAGMSPICVSCKLGVMLLKGAGGLALSSEDGSSTWRNLSASSPVKLVAGDTIRLQIFQASGGASALTGGGYGFSGVRIGD